MSKTKLIIILTVFIDVIGMGVVIPVLPFYVESFGGTAFTMTLLFAVYSLFSFFSGPLLGRISDQYGRRPVLLLSLLSTSIGWFVFSFANSLWILFLGRIIDGSAAGNLPIAQSYLVDIAKDEKERTSNLGLIGAAFGIGLIIGPALGGALAHFGHSVPFLFVGILALLNTIVGYFILPETNKNKGNSKSKISINPFKPLLNLTRDKKLLPAYIIWFLFGIAATMTHAIFALYLYKSFGYKEQASALFLTGVGLMIALNQGFALKKFWLKNFSERKLEFWLLLIFSCGVALEGVRFFTVFIIGLIISTFTQSVLRVVINSQITGKSDPLKRGEILGLLSSISSLGMIIAPLLAGMAFEFNISLPFFISSALAMIAFLIAWFERNRLMNLEEGDETVMIEQGLV